MCSLNTYVHSTYVYIHSFSLLIYNEKQQSSALSYPSPSLDSSICFYLFPVLFLRWLSPYLLWYSWGEKKDRQLWGIRPLQRLLFICELMMRGGERGYRSVMHAFCFRLKVTTWKTNRWIPLPDGNANLPSFLMWVPKEDVFTQDLHSGT